MASSIFISNLDDKIEEGVLLSFFAFCGPFKGYSFDRERGTGLIHFASYDSVLISKHLDGCQLGNRFLSVESLNLYGTTPQTQEVLLLLPRLTVPPQNDFRGVEKVVSREFGHHLSSHSYVLLGGTPNTTRGSLVMSDLVN
eukprot:TRINITY_DN2310_c0_g2_i4.p1 TRINITY_DN2310_c0_g2~~TRINITY_DN2310_c0_g2_i4.p1  ORF type:complete len:141 (-),score=35.08 TRINITY_DN2310_c0_g2_i4:76-498(-)